MSINVAKFLAEQAVAQPSAAAVRAPRANLPDGSIDYEELSFEELEAEASAVAHLLTKRGVRRGTRILLMVQPGLDLIRIVFALFKIGAPPVVIDPGMGLRGFLRCVERSEPEALIGIPKAFWVASVFRRVFASAQIRLRVDRRLPALVESAKADGAFPVVDSAADDLAAVLFTSGSTGPAKGVCYTHGMFAAQVEAVRGQYGIERGEVDLPMLPVFALFNPALGMCTVVPEMNPSRPASVDPKKIVQAIVQNEVTNSFGSPALWTKIARYCEANGITLPSIRRVLVAGAPVPPALMRKMREILPNGELHSPYGATEALPVSSISAAEVLDETEARTSLGEGTCVGRALPGVQIKVVEPFDGPIEELGRAKELPVGEIGEIIVRGPTVTRDYDKLPNATAAAKIGDGDGFWHRMGDLGKLDAEGRLWFCGRKAERVVTKEGPLDTDCCEAIFNGDPRVFRSALIDSGGGVPAVAVEPEPGAFPRGRKAREAFATELRKRALANSGTRTIERFFFEKRFPVDVRHNAKIHRLSLAKKFRQTEK